MSPIKHEAFRTPGSNSIDDAVNHLVKGRSRDELLAIAGGLIAGRATSELGEDAPKTRKELWHYIKKTWSIEISDVAVCPEHDPPFEFIWLGYSESVPNLFCIGPRSGGKSFDTALLMELNSRFKPGCDSMVFGAVDDQNKKVYDDLIEHFINCGLPEGESEIVGQPTLSLTVYKNGSKARSYPGTFAKMNGQHPPKAHCEETEIFNERAYKEAQPLWASVATPTGWKTIGDLEVGDLVFGRDGKPTRVTKVIDYEDETEVYEVRMTDGRSTVCCGDHLWTTATDWRRRKNQWSIVRTIDMIEIGLKLPCSYRFGIPHGEAVEFDVERDHPLPPYVLGVMLGDGHIDTGTFVSSDPEIAVKVDGLLSHQYKLASTDHNGSTRYCISPHSWRSAPKIASVISELGLGGAKSDTKFIPTEYLIAKRSDRLELLRGLMDTDGCAIEGNSVAQFATISLGLANDVRELVFSLGGRAIFRTKTFKSEWSSGTLYTLDISFGDGTIPFSLERKSAKMAARNRTLDPSIKSIASIGFEPVRCIGVDNDDATYRTTNYIVTHNSRNMATDKVIGSKRIRAQNFATSTRKYKNGRVDKIYKSFLVAVAKAKQFLGPAATKDEIRDHVAMTSPWWCVIYCTFEISQQVSNCRTAPENAGRPDSELCKCNLVENGVWDNGEPRTFDQVCRGRLYRSRGHRSYEENIQLFLQNDRGTYEAQQLCGEAESEGLYVKSFSRRRHGLSSFLLDPANGPFYSGTDWGTTDAAAVLYVQYAARPISAVGVEGNPVLIKPGDRIVFAEIYEEGKTSGELGQSAIIKERKLANALTAVTLVVRRRWADLQGAGDRKTWKKMGLPTAKYSTRNFDEHVKEMRELFDAGRAWVVVDYDPFTGMGCPVFVDQIEGWRKDEHGNEDRTIPQHLCAAGRYVFYGMHDIYNDPGALQSTEVAEAMASVQQGGVRAPAAVSYSRSDPSGGEAVPREDWMSNFDAPSLPR